MKIILDCDTGIDDAMAILYLAAQPEAEIVAVGVVHGNTEARLAGINSQHVLDLCGLSSVPVAIGAAAPLAQPLSISPHVHGEDGLGGAAPPRAMRAFATETAAEQMIRLARAAPGVHTILALGPLTNLALAVHLAPDFPSLVAGVVLMGGAVARAGNVTPVAEANIWHDPEAADTVFGADWPVTMVGLDVTMQTWLRQPDLDRIAASPTPRGRFTSAILRQYLSFYHSIHGDVGCPLHDPAAAVLMLHPELATYGNWPVRVEVRGALTRGMTVADRRPKPESPVAFRRSSRVAMTIDSARIIEQVLDSLLGGPV